MCISGFIFVDKDLTCFQYIEGPREKMSQLIQNIKNDPRQHDFVTLKDHTHDELNMLPWWGMGWVQVDQVNFSKAMNAFWEDALKID